MVVFLVGADPEPVVGAVALPGDRAVATADVDGVNAPLFLQTQRGMRGFAWKRAKFLSASF